MKTSYNIRLVATSPISPHFREAKEFAFGAKEPEEEFFALVDGKEHVHIVSREEFPLYGAGDFDAAKTDFAEWSTAVISGTAPIRSDKTDEQIAAEAEAAGN